MSLIVCRSLLGFAEAGGVPATGKGFAMYLPPKTGPPAPRLARSA